VTTRNAHLGESVSVAKLTLFEKRRVYDSNRRTSEDSNARTEERSYAYLNKMCNRTWLCGKKKGLAEKVILQINAK
jgi:hypothetical protein